MTRAQVTIVAVGATVFSVWLVVGGNVAEQTAFLVDAGYTGASHVATCPVRFDPACVAQANDAGIPVHTYEQLRFPVALRTLPDAGVDVQLPPMNLGIVQECFRVVDWRECTLVGAVAEPTITALIGQELPFSLAGAVRPCVRPNFDAGLMCLRADGGQGGNRNVFRRADALATATCEPVQCLIYLGDDPERDL